MRAQLLTVAILGAATGCAPSGRSSPSEADAADVVHLVVTNEYATTVTAYALWPGRRRLSLGEVASDETVTFQTTYRTNRLVLGIRAITAASATTAAGPTRLRFQGGRGTASGSNVAESDELAIGPGDTIELRLAPNGALYFRRIAPS